MSLPTRTLGRNGPQVPAIGFGAMSIGGAYGQKDSKEDKLKVLDRAYELGERFWDTADIYFDSEERIGEWFKRSGKRDDIFLATKFGLTMDPETMKSGVRTDPEYVRLACEKSLATMGIETIDLYYAHRVDGVTPIEKTIEAMVQLKKEGKIRHLGLSECSADTLYRASKVHPISAYQVEYSPFCLDIESPEYKALEACRELGITVVAYSPVGRGLLTGQIKSFDDLDENDFRRQTPKYSRENFPKILDLVEKFKSVAANHNVTVAQACLAWVMAQGDDIIPIPGTRTIKYLEENVAAAYVKLTADEIQELRKHAEATEMAGGRYPEFFNMGLFADTPALV